MPREDQYLDPLIDYGVNRLDMDWPENSPVELLPAPYLPDYRGDDLIRYLQREPAPAQVTDNWRNTDTSDAPAVYHLGLLNRVTDLRKRSNDWLASWANGGSGGDTVQQNYGTDATLIATSQPYGQDWADSTVARDSLSGNTIMDKPVELMGDAALRLSVSAGSDRVKQIAAREIARREQAAMPEAYSPESGRSRFASRQVDEADAGEQTIPSGGNAPSTESDALRSSEPDYIKDYAVGWASTAATVRAGDGWIRLGKRTDADPQALAVVNARDGSVALRPGQYITLDGTTGVSDTAKAVVQHIWDDEAAIAKTAGQQAERQKLGDALRERIISDPLGGLSDKLRDGLRGAGDILALPIGSARDAVAADEASARQPYLTYYVQGDNGYQDTYKAIRVPNPSYTGPELRPWDGSQGLSYADAFERNLPPVPGPLGSIAAFPFLVSGGDPSDPNLQHLTQLADATEGMAAVYGVPVLARPSINNTPNKTVRVFRVEGKGNQRLKIDEAGNVDIPIVGVKKEKGVKRNLYLNFGDNERHGVFLNQRSLQYSDNVTKSFEVPTSFFNELREAEVWESERSQYPDRPVIADPTKAANQYGLATPQIQKLRQVIIPGSGRHH